MRPRIIETMEQWNILKAALIEKGYRLFQMQYRAEQDEGHHAWFTKDGKRIEVITHNKEIEKDIVNSDLT